MRACSNAINLRGFLASVVLSKSELFINLFENVFSIFTML